jgi:hypothetical protein
MKGGQYSSADDERTSAELRAELAILKQKIFTTPRAGERSILKQIREIEFTLTRRLQNGDTT